MKVNSYYYPPVNFASIWFEEMVRVFAKKNGKSVSMKDSILDVGCGLGNNCFGMLKYSPKRIMGVDISHETIDLLNTFGQKIEFRKLDICTDDISSNLNAFTLIYSCDVYEHVEDPQIMLTNLNQLLENGGCICITFPNEDNHGHNQISRFSDFESMLKKAGFNNYNVKIVERPSFFFSISMKMYRIPQVISDLFFRIKRRDTDIRPESDEFHEMYAYRKIKGLKEKRTLLITINVLLSLMKKLSRISLPYKLSSNTTDLRNKRLILFAVKD